MAETIIERFITKEKIFPYAMKFTVLLGISVAAPFIGFQAVTGTIVNATLFIAAVLLGRKEAVMIGMFPSLISVISGLLVPAVVPLVPFIILSNALLVMIFSFLRKEHYWKAVVAASVLKFLFLFVSAKVLASVFSAGAFVKIAAAMFSWQQLLTALSGGIVAYATLKILKKI